MSDLGSSKPRLGITLGDAAGIGPEILAQLLADEQQALDELCEPVVIGDARAIKRGFEIARREPPHLEIVDALPPRGQQLAPTVLDLGNLSPGDYVIGEVGRGAGRAAGEYIERAVQLALEGELDGIVTCPIHKESFRLGGWGERFAGHTEMLAALGGAERACMMLAAGLPPEAGGTGELRVCHVTTHVSLLEALTRHITAERIVEVIGLADEACRRLGIAQPRVGVAAINPHGGEGGAFGDEEQRLVLPALQQVRAAGIDAEGPVPADTLFSKARGGLYDVVVAMYHDQGHIPVKLSGFIYDADADRWTMHGVNVTLGLPFVRTSVDHGTAFDRAGKGTSDHRSLLEAVRYAAMLTRSA